ncbi:lipopolysaccharide assembly protein LapB [Terribacillus sp. DMT04]|uniref:tetratricopeptide repeat protein n=1 Tax=Terribacillus sp. DMT04 TaxID=2850441 RepID=UPI001C2B8459|nr:tetratricopeptide repeat protein [Terribacillus sp. DMT04]QXE02268.1 tetratricopeptide repeat protein [Terribacillus sp. DMT04]
MNIVLSETDKNLSALLLDFYDMIKQERKEAAAILAEVIEALKKDAAAEGVLVAADLHFIRYKIMNEEIDEAERLMGNFEAKGRALTPVNAYYYHYFKGQIFLQENKWKDAIRYFEHAELYITREEEKADFYYKLANAYYQAYIPALSAFHAAKALGYAAAHNQELHAAKCNLLLGLNHLEARNFNRAESHLLEALAFQPSETTSSSELTAMVHHNLGLLAFVQQKFKEAIHYFEQAVQTTTNKPCLKSIYYLTESLFHTDRQQEALHFYQIGFEMSKTGQDMIYQWAFAMLHKQFIDRDCFESVWSKGISYFESIEDKSSVYYYSLRLARYYTMKGEAKPANYYYQLAMQ